MSSKLNMNIQLLQKPMINIWMGWDDWMGWDKMGWDGLEWDGMG
jgi:hypothetical protein